MPAEVYYQKICTIHKKTHVLKSFLNKAADHKAWNFIKKRLQHRCFPANTGKFLNNLFRRTSVYACFCRDFTKWLIKAFFLDRRFQNQDGFSMKRTYRFSSITITPVTFKPEPSYNFNYHLAYLLNTNLYKQQSWACTIPHRLAWSSKFQCQDISKFKGYQFIYFQYELCMSKTFVTDRKCCKLELKVPVWKTWKNVRNISNAS